MANKIEITLNMEKVTKQMVKFAEPVANEFVPEKLGGIYLNKMILAENEYNGKPITVIIRKAEKQDAGILMKMEKVTKGTVKFNEVVNNEFSPAIIGSLYVPKYTLAEIEYNGEDIAVEIEFDDE